MLFYMFVWVYLFIVRLSFFSSEIVLSVIITVTIWTMYLYLLSEINSKYNKLPSCFPTMKNQSCKNFFLGFWLY